VLGDIRPRHRALEFRKFLDQIEASVSSDLDVHIILDNYSTHQAPKIRAWFAKHPRFHVHFTPTYASWINQVERWFAGLEAKQLRRGSYTSVAVLKTAIWAYIEASNTAGKPFVWTKSADQILANIARFAQRTVQVHGAKELISRTTFPGH
jgi:transposase